MCGSADGGSTASREGEATKSPAQLLESAAVMDMDSSGGWRVVDAFVVGCLHAQEMKRVKSGCRSRRQSTDQPEGAGGYCMCSSRVPRTQAAAADLDRACCPFTLAVATRRCPRVISCCW